MNIAELYSLYENLPADSGEVMYVRLQQGYEDKKPKQIQAMIAEEANIETEEVMDIIKKAKNKIAKTESKHVETIPENKVDGWHNMLKGDTEALEKFKKRRGLSDEIINRYKIGWDGTERYLIPIRDEQGNVVNVRKYSPDVSGGDKMISYAKGYGEARLFPLESLQGDSIMICEGELDASMVTMQYPIQAVQEHGKTLGTSCFRVKT
jgi:hypothetical protein